MPRNLESDITVVGQTNFRGQKRPFGIYTDDRRRHIYLIGKTGVGKTTLIKNMLIQDIANGKGVGLVDPHGDLAEEMLEYIPPHRINEVVYFDPSDTEYPIAFNVLEAIDPQYKYLVASGLVSSLKKIWADSWGPRLEYILRNTILALLDYPSSTMLGIMRMLSDKTYRKKVVEKIADPVVKAFWVNEFANYNERFRSEAISPIQNKVGQFLSSAIVRNIVAQPKSTIDMRDIIDNGKILIINASKGKIGEDNSALLGAMMITKIQLAAMNRANIPEKDRKDFYLYVDEFQNFATESFATILSEARKYRLNLVIAHQYITQMEEPVRDAVFGNVGTMVVFRVGAFDAEFMKEEFAPHFNPPDLVNLDKYNAIAKLMIDGITSKPFSMQTIPPSEEVFENREKVIKVSRERYGRRRDFVEDKIARWSGVGAQDVAQAERFEEEQRERQDYGRRSNRNMGRRDYNDQPRRDFNQQRPAVREERLADVVLRPTAGTITNLSAALQQQHGHEDQERREDSDRRDRQPRDDRPRFEVTCDRCGKKTDVPFEPRPGKPVYCRSCYEIVKREAREAQENPQMPAPLPQTRQSPTFQGPRPPNKDR